MGNGWVSRNNFQFQKQKKVGAGGREGTIKQTQLLERKSNQIEWRKSNASARFTIGLDRRGYGVG